MNTSNPSPLSSFLEGRPAVGEDIIQDQLLIRVVKSNKVGKGNKHTHTNNNKVKGKKRKKFKKRKTNLKKKKGKKQGKEVECEEG